MKKTFKKIYIEITNCCNLSCSFCSKTSKPKRTMTIEEFKNIISKIKSHTDYIYLHVKGEPLLHKDLKEFLKIAEENDLKVNLTTNGTLFSQRVDDLKNSKALKKVNFSLHSENNYPNYFENIFQSVDKLPKDITVIYRLWTLSNSALDKKSTEIVEKLKDYYNLSPQIVDKLYKEQNVKISSNIYVDKDNEFIWPKVTEEKSNGYCHALKTHLGILVDGTVVPCCLDASGIINLGSIYTDTLENIMTTERYRKLKKSFQDHKPSEALCASCTYKNKNDF
ncbi:MAG: radical SAM protein [Tenericutes bacterium]|nr:radical SAM protein [Mycoplasmatota bacterium]